MNNFAALMPHSGSINHLIVQQGQKEFFMTRPIAAALGFCLASAAAGHALAQSVAPSREPKVPALSQSAVTGPSPNGKIVARHRAATRRTDRARPARDEGAGWRELIAKHAQAHGIPFGLGNAVVRIESRYNARIIHAGNYGLMQIRPQTARGVGYTGTPAGLLDPDTNLHFGMKYLAIGYREANGDTCRTLMRYQSGTLARHVSAANKVYCAKALRLMAGK